MDDGGTPGFIQKSNSFVSYGRPAEERISSLDVKGHLRRFLPRGKGKGHVLQFGKVFAETMEDVEIIK